MRFARFTVVAALVALALPASAGAKTTTLKVKGGSTALTFAPAAAQQLVAMGITLAPIAPATAGAGGAIVFPIASGKLKVTSGKHPKITGTVADRGGITLSNQIVSIALNQPSVALAGKQSALNATSSIGGSAPLAIQMATLDLSKAKLSITSKRVKISGVNVKLTGLAASSMNAAFSVTGFTTGFLIGTATLQADVKR